MCCYDENRKLEKKLYKRHVWVKTSCNNGDGNHQYSTVIYTRIEKDDISRKAINRSLWFDLFTNFRIKINKC